MGIPTSAFAAQLTAVRASGTYRYVAESQAIKTPKDHELRPHWANEPANPQMALRQ